MFKSKNTTYLLLHIWATLSIFSGALLVVFSSHLDDFFHIIIGITLCALSSFSLFVGISHGNCKKDSDSTVTKNSVLLAIGVIILASPHSQLITCVIWGVYSIFKSAAELQSIVHAFYLRKYRILRLSLTIAEMVLGILLLLELTDGIGHHIVFLGITFVVQGINYTIVAVRKKELHLRMQAVTDDAFLKEVFNAVIRNKNDVDILQGLLDEYKPPAQSKEKNDIPPTE